MEQAPMSPEIAPDRARFTGMLPGLDPRQSDLSELERATRRTIAAREGLGLLTDLDAALVALAIADARKLDLTIDEGRPSGRAKLIQTMSDVLAALPAPEGTTSDVLELFLAAIMGGRRLDDDAERLDLLVPKVDPPEVGTGLQESGVRTTLRARYDAGLSVPEFEAHERLALMAAHDLDRALTVGAPSGYALLAGVMQTVLERLPRPETVDSSELDELLAAAIEPPGSNPFTALPPAKYHPERDESWLSEGEEIAALNRARGRHLMPWQRRAIDVATEYRLDELGRRCYRYGEVVITVPRQSGKTDVVGPVQLHRAISRGEPAACWYTAQTGADARKRMMDLIQFVEESRLRLLFTSTRAAGAEGLKVNGRPGSHVSRFSPTFSALHGEHPHLVTMDEFWHYKKDLGDALDGAIEPGQITLGSRAQTWRISTMGTHTSDYMNEIVERGRAGDDPNLCYIEYSLPDGADPFDPDVWRRFHPAVGNTITIGDLQKRADRAQTSPARIATWKRAYCNVVVASDGSLFDLARWDDLAEEVPAPARGDVAYSFEVAPDAVSASILAAWRDVDTGRRCVRIVEHRPNPGEWLVPHVMALMDTKQPRVVAADSAGPASRFVKQLVDAGREIRTLTFDEYGQACEGLLEAAGEDGDLIQDGTDELRGQAAAAEVRKSNGVRRFSRDGDRPIPAIIAAAVAMYALEYPEASAESIVL